MKIKALAVFTIFLGVVGCKSETEYVTPNGKVVLTDTIKRIRAPNSHNANVFFDNVFHLKPLSIDSSNVEIRIFRSHGLENDGIDLFVIKKDLSNKWIGFAASLNILEWGKDEKARYIPKNVSLPVKNDEWLTKANKLLSLGILRLKSYKEIQNYYLPTDADEVRVEYVFQGKIMSYELIDPFGNENIPDAKAMCDILNYIESDVGFNGFAHGKNK